MKPITGYTDSFFAVWYDLLHSLGKVVTPYRQEEIKMWRVWSLVEEDCGHCHFCADKPKFGGPRRKKQCPKRKWVNNNFPFTEIIMLRLTTFMWFCEGSLLSVSTTKSGKTYKWISQISSSSRRILPDIPVPVLQQIESTNIWPKDLVHWLIVIDYCFVALSYS